MREWLKEIRIKKELTQYDIAEMAQVGRSYYTHIENGNKTPSVKVAKKIAAVLDFNWTKFYEDEEDQE